MLTMGSLFDGIGGFPLAAVHNGITPLWASEIEAFPIEVTKQRFPRMIHVGDITKLDGADLPPVDIICGGSPCQDLSVAGKRRGLAGERSGLFMDQIRIVKEMRLADGERAVPAYLIRPRYLVWENVPGAFSSAEGEDFRAVIEEIIHVKDGTGYVPRPDTGRWESAGAAVLGDEFSLAWRVLDAQYWGVAQRRRRIFLVADFGGRTAPQILFEQDSLSGDTAQSGGPWQGAAAPAHGSTADTGGACLTPWDVQSRRIFPGGGTWPALYGGEGGGHGYIQTEETDKGDVPTVERDEVIDLHGISGAPLATRNMQTPNTEPLLCLNDQGGDRMDVTEEVTTTLRAGMGGHPPLVSQPNSYSGRHPRQKTVAGMSGNNQSVPFENHRIDTTDPDSSKNQGSIAILQETICIAGNTIDREVQNGGNGLGCQPNISYTLTGMDRHAVFSRQPYQDTVGTIGYSDHKGINNQYVSEDKCVVEKQHLIRRLTPLECERLQGFPDGWSDIPGASDSARYKALGNSVAIPCVDFVLRGIAYFLRRIKGEDNSTM